MQGIVIQGPTNYCNQVAPVFKNIPNVVWSTWKDEPQKNIDFINQYIPVILSDKPSFPGYLNINMQTVSTLAGVKYLQEKGVTEIFKTRGDIHIPHIDKLLSLLKGKKIAFMVMCKEGVRSDLYYELEYPHYSHDYPMDIVLYGSIDNVFNSFNFMVDDWYTIPPESLIAYHFFVGKNLEFKLNYKHFIDNNIYFFLNDCLENKIELTWLKHNVDLVQMHNSKDYYEF
jgi:hypothetical protein